MRPHGGDFEYRSTLTCVLALLAERATGLRVPELISRHLWRRLGAEHDAEITVDRNGHALADIGVCCTARVWPASARPCGGTGCAPTGRGWCRKAGSPTP